MRDSDRYRRKIENNYTDIDKSAQEDKSDIRRQRLNPEMELNSIRRGGIRGKVIFLK